MQYKYVFTSIPTRDPHKLLEVGKIINALERIKKYHIYKRFESTAKGEGKC
jgi:hypothetical protein